MLAPASTYRLQINAGFTLQDAASTLPYLHDLGVDWVYLSPLLRAEPGSDHGYDVVDHSQVDPARGGPEGLAAVTAEARRLEMGVLVDIVPNHVGVATPRENPWWWDLLLRGRSSAYADAFDVDWDAGERKGPHPGRRRRRQRRHRDRRARGRRAVPRPRVPARARHRDAGGAALRARLVAAGRQRAELPTVLRRQHPGRHPGRGPAGLRRVACRDQALVRRGPRRRAARRPSRRAARPRGVPRRPARAHRRGLRAGREDPGARRGAAGGVGHGGHHRVRRARARRPRPHRPGGAGAADGAGDAAARHPPGLARPDPRHEAGRGRRDPRLGDPPGGSRGGRHSPTGRSARARSSTRSPSWPRASRSTAPTCPGAATGSTPPRSRRGADVPIWRRRSTSSSRCWATLPGRRPGASSRPRAR